VTTQSPGTSATPTLGGRDRSTLAVGQCGIRRGGTEQIRAGPRHVVASSGDADTVLRDQPGSRPGDQPAIIGRHGNAPASVPLSEATTIPAG